MTNGNFPSRYVDGTSALKVTNWEKSARSATIIPFPACRPDESRQNARSIEGAPKSLKAKVRNILEASEMYCSLMLEDFRGCSYNIFTRKGIGTLAISASVLAIVSIAVGA